MEGRRRGKQAEPPPATAPTTRQTRQTRRENVSERNKNATASVPHTQPPKGGNIGWGQVPRRTAPKTGTIAPSIASIPTQLGNQSDEDEDVDESPEPSLVGDEVLVEQSGDPEDPEDEDDEEEEKEEVESEVPSETSSQFTYIKTIMARTIPDLEHGAQRLLDHLRHPEPELEAWKAILKYKVDSFKLARDLYFAVGSFAPFLSVDLAKLVPPSMAPETRAAVLHANIATALNGLHSLGNEEFNAAPFWEKFDEAFVQAFLQFPTIRGAQCALEVRTQHAIAKMETVGKSAKPYDIVAEAFCEDDDDKTSVDLVSTGPWKSVGLTNEDDHAGACIGRLEDILSLVKPKKDALSNLKRAYPLDKVRSALRLWLLDMDGNSTRQHPAPEPTPQQSQKKRQFVELDDESDDSSVESEEIIRIQPGQSYPTLFTGPESIGALLRSGRSRAPPSNQQGSVGQPDAPPDYPDEVGKPDAPSDYPDEANSAILEGVPRSSAYSPPGARQDRATEEDLGENMSDDDDDPFEEDNRIANKGKRRASAFALTPSSSKRPRIHQPTFSSPEPYHNRVQPGSRAASSAFPNPQQRSTNSQTASARRHPRLSYPSSNPLPPPPSRPPASSADFRAIAERKRALVSSQRAMRPPTTQIRRPWSDHDSQLLLRFIGTHLSKWADIGKQGAMTAEEMERVRTGGPYPDRDVFEHPRNQQAYRDKARNMKVDFLLTDAVLPPGFDTVALSSKEKRRVESMGKNPDRREADVDGGMAVNTEI